MKFCLLVGAVLGFVVSLILGPPVIARQLAAWQLLPRPDGVSELYFTDYRKLPRSLALGSVTKLAFTVRNIEHKTMMYHYVVTGKTGDGTTHLLRTGELSLQHDQLQNVRERITLPVTEGPLLVTVTLRYGRASSQAIHYWLTLVKETS